MVGDVPTSVDVFVVGGGPAGLATAVEACRLGMSVLVADGAVPPIDKPCGEGLMPDGVEALRALGVTIGTEQGFAFRGIRFLSDGSSAEATFPNGLAYGMRRTELHRLIVDHAAAVGVQTAWQTVVTGLHSEGVCLGSRLVRARWIVGADGTASRVRRWAGLEARHPSSLRFAFRRHYSIAPWADFMELYWGRRCQIYVTPVSTSEICVAVISNSPQLRLDDGLSEFPELADRLRKREHSSTERGAITLNRSLPGVYRGRVVLVGDASAGVDAITGEGLCLAFRQAALLADCLANDDLASYQREHRAIARRPALMARLMLLLGRQHRLRQRTMHAFHERPPLFHGMLAMHVGAGTTREYLANGVALGWNLLTA